MPEPTPGDWTPGLTDEDLLRRAVANARSRNTRGFEHYRWVAVKEAFSLGSTYAKALCQRFGIDPDEMLRR
jgi:hypothetical protein